MASLDLGRLPGSLSAAVTRLQLMKLMRTNTPASGIDDFVRANGYTISESGVGPPSPNALLTYFALTTSNDFFLFLDGVRAASQGQDLWNFYTGNALGNLTDDQNWPSGWMAEALANSSHLVPRASRIHLVGYSAGGVSLFRFRARVGGSIGPLAAVNLTTFGCPKAVDPSLTGYGPWDSEAHWQNVDDAVCLVPPDISGFQRFMAGLSVFQGRRITSFQQLPSRIVVNLDLSLTTSPPYNQSGVSQSDAVGAWLAAQSTGTQTGHSFDVYLGRLAAILARVSPATTAFPTPIVTPPAEVPTLRTVTRAQQLAVQTVFVAAGRQNLPQEQLVESQAFTAGRVGKIWGVYLGPILVCYAPFKKRARGLANAGNNFCRRLQKEAVVFPDALAAQFVEYLAAASDPAGGFVPVMNVPH